MWDKFQNSFYKPHMASINEMFLNLDLILNLYTDPETINHYFKSKQLHFINRTGPFYSKTYLILMDLTLRK